MSARYEIGYTNYGENTKKPYTTHTVECDYIVENSGKVMFYRAKKGFLGRTKWDHVARESDDL